MDTGETIVTTQWNTLPQTSFSSGATIKAEKSNGASIRIGPPGEVGYVLAPGEEFPPPGSTMPPLLDLSTLQAKYEGVLGTTGLLTWVGD